MYIYLDENGTIKEIINDEALRQTASNVNSIYVYFNTTEKFSSLLCSYELPDGTVTEEAEVATTTTMEEIPYDAKRDLKYFEYFKEYEFFSFKISDEALSQDGVVRATLRFVASDKSYIKVVGLLTFNVEAEVNQSDYGITTSQYNYLVENWLKEIAIAHYEHLITLNVKNDSTGEKIRGELTIINNSMNTIEYEDLLEYIEKRTNVHFTTGYYIDASSNAYLLNSYGYSHDCFYLNPVAIKDATSIVAVTSLSLKNTTDMTISVKDTVNKIV